MYCGVAVVDEATLATLCFGQKTQSYQLGVASGAPTDQEIEKCFFVAFTFLAEEPQKILYLNLDFRSFLTWNSL